MPVPTYRDRGRLGRTHLTVNSRDLADLQIQPQEIGYLESLAVNPGDAIAATRSSSPDVDRERGRKIPEGIFASDRLRLVPEKPRIEECWQVRVVLPLFDDQEVFEHPICRLWRGTEERMCASYCL